MHTNCQSYSIMLMITAAMCQCLMPQCCNCCHAILSCRIVASYYTAAPCYIVAAAIVDDAEYLLQHAAQLLHVMHCLMWYRRCHCVCHRIYVAACHTVALCCTVAAATVDATEYLLQYAVQSLHVVQLLHVMQLLYVVQLLLPPSIC